MTRQWLWSGVAFWTVMLFASPALANYLSGVDVVISEPITEDVYVAGESVEVRASVEGDLAVAGREILINAPLAKDLLAAGDQINVEAPVGENVRAAGRRVRLNSTVSGHVVLAGAEVTLDADANIADWAWVAGREVRISGAVGQSLRVAAQTVIISGQIAGDAHIRADHLELLPGARIAGELQFFSASEPLIADDAEVSGGVTTTTVERLQLPAWAGAVGWIFAGLTLLITVVVIYLVMPRFTTTAADRLLVSPLKSVGVGIGTLVGLPLVIVMLLATGLGALLGLVLLVGYFLWLLLGYAVACVFLAMQGLRLISNAEALPWYVSALAIAVAVLLLLLIQWIPFGGLVVFLLFLFAFGATTLRAWDTRT